MNHGHGFTLRINSGPGWKDVPQGLKARRIFTIYGPTKVVPNTKPSFQQPIQPCHMALGLMRYVFPIVCSESSRGLRSICREKRTSAHNCPVRSRKESAG
jgi:hypothetical protein